MNYIPCLNDNYSYLIKDDQTNTVAIIDPSEFGPCNGKIDLKYKKLDFILNTHHHFDHVGGNAELKKKYGSRVLGFENDKKRIPAIDILLKDGQELTEYQIDQTADPASSQFGLRSILSLLYRN